MDRPQLPEDLIQVLAALDAEALAKLLTDLLTPTEIQSANERWAIVKGLARGETQRHVRDQVGVSVATVSRGARQLRYGTGGFALAFATLGRLGLGDPREGAS